MASKNIAIVVGSKGRGSNMANLVYAERHNQLQGHIRMVVGAKVEAPAMLLAKELGTDLWVGSLKDGASVALLLDQLRAKEIELICLAGYMMLFPPEILRSYSGRVINIHPALLPKFGGKGMYGSFVHESVIAAKETESGCTIHYVSEVYDEGAIILQERCPVFLEDTPESLAARVLECEHRAYPIAVNMVIDEIS